MAERFVTLLIVLCSTIYLLEARSLTFGSLASPKSGFVPILAGTVTLSISLWLLAKQIFSSKRSTPERIDWTKFIFIIIGFLFYTMILDNIGYFPATGLLLFYLFKVPDTQGWIFPLVLASGCSLAFYLLFANYLAIPLP